MSLRLNINEPHFTHGDIALFKKNSTFATLNKASCSINIPNKKNIN